MLRLDLKPLPTWHDLTPGLRVQLAPLTTAPGQSLSVTRLDAMAELVEGFELAPHLAKPLYMLSTGSKRKVLMAAALASGAPLTLIDEPVAGLDHGSVRYLCQALAATSAAQPGRAIVVAHYEALAGVPWRDVIELPKLG